MKAPKCRAMLSKTFHYVIVIIVALLLHSLTLLFSLAMLAAYTAAFCLGR